MREHRTRAGKQGSTMFSYHVAAGSVFFSNIPGFSQSCEACGSNILAGFHCVEYPINSPSKVYGSRAGRPEKLSITVHLCQKIPQIGFLTDLCCECYPIGS